MSDKYIIKNCPCNQYGNHCIASDKLYPKYCQDCTDCKLKQIVELCKEHPLCDCACGDDILKLLDIEECE